jgi:hypothetical protein
VADFVEKVACGASDIYGLYGAISAGTASSMMMVSKMPFREFFNEIGTGQTLAGFLSRAE